MEWQQLWQEIQEYADRPVDSPDKQIVVSSSVRRNLRNEVKPLAPRVHYFAFGYGQQYRLVISKKPIQLSLKLLDKKTLELFKRQSKIQLLDQIDNEEYDRQFSSISWRRFLLDALVTLGGEAEFYKHDWHLKKLILERIKESPSFQDWLQLDVVGERCPLPIQPIKGCELSEKHKKANNIYFPQNNGKHFIAIDLKEANYQVLRLNNLVKEPAWLDFLKTFTDIEWFHRVKRWRMISLSDKELLPRKQATLWENMTIEILKMLIYAGIFDKDEFCVWNSDEIVFHIDKEDASKRVEEIKRFLNNEKSEWSNFMKVETFELQYVPAEKPLKDFYVKRYENGKLTFKCVDSLLYLEALALYKETC
jgi:hypothetical protein